MENDPLKKMMSDTFDHNLDLISAQESLDGFTSHFLAALFAENDVKAERERQSAVAAFEALLDKRQEAVKDLIRKARKANND